MAKTKEPAKAEERTLTTNKIGIKEGLGYMAGDAGNLFVLTYVSSFLKIFYTDVLKIDMNRAKNVFLFPRLWDAINDPIWGALVARWPARKDGKFRPYIKWIAVPLALSQIVCFFNVGSFTQSETLKLVFAYVTYILFGMLYTGINVPFGSLASRITDDPDGRTLLSTFRTIGGGIGGAAPLLIAPLLIYSKVSDGQGGTYNVANGKGMFLFALVMGGCSILFYFLCYANTRERVHAEETAKADMKGTYRAMLKSRPFIILALTGILISGQLQFTSLNQYLYKNYFCNTNLSILGTIAQYAPMVVMIPITPMLVRRFGKKEISTVGAFLSAAAAVLTAVLRPKPSNAGLYIFLLFVIGFGYSFVSITNWAVVTDVIDFQQYTTGEHAESAIYAVYTFCRKLGQTAADSGGMKLLSKAGYTESMANAGFVASVSPRILTVCTVIPAITYSLIFLLYVLFPLTKKKMAPVYEAVHKQNTEQ